MIGSLEERKVFEEIQKKLFYMIPEKWESIHLYASIIEEPFKKPIGEMYFYYFPKGILKKDPINVYEIPSLFNIDEQSYNELIDKLYGDIKKLRKIAEEKHPNLWSNITITIANCKFKIEYDYENLSKNDMFTDYERHVIWRYNNLNIDLELESKQDRYIINKYLNYIRVTDLPEKEEFIEGIYLNPVNNIIDYEKTMTIEAALAMKKESEEKKNKKDYKDKKGFIGKLKNKNTLALKEKEDEYGNNQILFRNKKDDENK